MSAGQLDLLEFADDKKHKLRPADMCEVINIVCRICEVDEPSIKKHRSGKVGNAVDARERKAKNIIAYILADVYKMKLTAIAHEFGLADHSTIHYRVKLARKAIKEDATFRATFVKCMRHFAVNQMEAQNVFHDIATYVLLHLHTSMPRPFVYELNRMDEWLKPHGFKLALTRLKEKKDV